MCLLGDATRGTTTMWWKWINQKWRRWCESRCTSDKEEKSGPDSVMGKHKFWLTQLMSLKKLEKINCNWLHSRWKNGWQSIWTNNKLVLSNQMGPDQEQRWDQTQAATCFQTWMEPPEKFEFIFSKFENKTAGYHRHIFRRNTNILINICPQLKTRLLFKI